MGVSKSSIGKNNSRISLSLPLANEMISRDNMSVVASNLGSEESTGSYSKGSLAGLIGLGVESRGSKDGRHLMDSSGKVTIVSSHSLVASNSYRDSSIGWDHLCLHLWDSIGNSWGNCSIGVSKSSIGKNNGRVSLSLSLANDVISRDNMCVITSNLGSEESTGSNSQGSLAGLIGLGVEGRGSKDGRHLMDSSRKITIITSNSLVATNSYRDSSICGYNLSLNLGDRD